MARGSHGSSYSRPLIAGILTVSSFDGTHLRVARPSKLPCGRLPGNDARGRNKNLPRLRCNSAMGNVAALRLRPRFHADERWFRSRPKSQTREPTTSHAATLNWPTVSSSWATASSGRPPPWPCLFFSLPSRSQQFGLSSCSRSAHHLVEMNQGLLEPDQPALNGHPRRLGAIAHAEFR